ncbi:winged helix-turn-helix domain-containing protein [Halovenus salina]|uniref:ArsR family transcriptional regulator n=1 Tax=Halovenus salina TaxID=1510225 RepID=A0ABD5W5C8_9EURY|nr:ArsR family transcriptional regulator [Halovenus salina]
MSSMTDGPAESNVSPAEALSVIANETRLDILEALWRAEDRPIRFSELFDRVDLEDSAQFNYHLKQLTDQFVAKSEKGYDLRFAGGQVIRAIRTGTFTRQPDIDPFDVQGSCTRCGGPLVASYADEQLSITCGDCEKAHGQYPFPPGGLADRTPEEIARAFDERVRHLHCLAADGVCPVCSGRMETTIEREEPCCLDVTVRAEHVCQQCRHELCSPVGLVLLDETRVASFYDNHGISLTDRPYWTLPWCVDDEYTTVESEDPFSISVRIPVGSEELHVTLDEELTVAETTCRGCS